MSPYPGKNENVTNYIRAAAEEAGGLLGRINGLQDNIYQYIKFEAEYHKLIQYKKTSIAFRAFSGIGYNYGNNEKFGETLPFLNSFRRRSQQHESMGLETARSWNFDRK